MAPQRPSSPTSLLWAHQLKREHNYLLKRVTDLESNNEKQQDRMKSAEVAAKAASSGEIASLAKQVKALQDKDSGLVKRVNDMEDDMTRKIEDAEADSEAMTMQIANLQKEERLVQEGRKQTLNRDKALLDRIGEVEEGLKKYERYLELVGKKVNDQQLGLIKEQLAGLTKRVMKEGSQMKLLMESIEKLEQANEDLKNANEELEERSRKRQFEAAAEQRRAANRPAADDDVAEVATPRITSKLKKKSHKWSGGGADRDIVREGAMLFPQPEAPPPTKDAAPRKAPAPLQKPKRKKGPVPKAPLTPGVRKSHKWNGGGADRDIVASGQPNDTEVKRPRSTEEEREAPSRKARKSADGKEVVRSGRGWYEVVESDSEEEEADSAPVKRKRGRPRKSVGPPEDESQVVGGMTRRGRLFPTLRDDEADLFEEGSGARQTRGQRQSQRAIKMEEEEDDDSFMRSAGPPVKATVHRARANVYGSHGYSHQVVRGAGKAKAKQLSSFQSEPRRTIPQDDD